MASERYPVEEPDAQSREASGDEEASERSDESFYEKYKRWLEESPFYEPTPELLKEFREFPDPQDQVLPAAVDAGEPPARERRFSRQIGLRLSFEDYEDLSRAAEEYGIAPTTLARMLVRRGVTAILRPPPRAPSG